MANENTQSHPHLDHWQSQLGFALSQLLLDKTATGSVKQMLA